MDLWTWMFTSFPQNPLKAIIQEKWYWYYKAGVGEVTGWIQQRRWMPTSQKRRNTKDRESHCAESLRSSERRTLGITSDRTLWRRPSEKRELPRSTHWMEGLSKQMINCRRSQNLPEKEAQNSKGCYATLTTLTWLCSQIV